MNCRRDFIECSTILLLLIIVLMVAATNENSSKLLRSRAFTDSAARTSVKSPAPARQIVVEKKVIDERVTLTTPDRGNSKQEQEQHPLLAIMTPAKLRQILAESDESANRKEFIKMVANYIRAKAGESKCPKSLPLDFCLREPTTFFLGLKEIRHNQMEVEMHDTVYKLLKNLLDAKKLPPSVDDGRADEHDKIKSTKAQSKTAMMMKSGNPNRTTAISGSNIRNNQKSTKKKERGAVKTPQQTRKLQKKPPIKIYFAWE